MTTSRSLEDIGARVFDAHGTLFDFAAAAGRCRDALDFAMSSLDIDDDA